VICGNRGKGKKLFFTGKKVFSLSPGPPIPFSKKAGYLLKGYAGKSGVFIEKGMQAKAGYLVRGNASSSRVLGEREYASVR